MKQLKYLTSATLMLVAFILIGEFFVWHTSSFFSNYPSTTLYLQEGQDNDMLRKDVEDAAMRTGIDVFVVDTDIKNSFSETINVYGTKNVQSLLFQNSVKPGTFNSLFLGTIELSFFPLEQLPAEFTPEVFFLTGSYEENVQFKQLLIDKYAGNFPRAEQSINDSLVLVAAMWFLVFSLVLLMSLYELALNKREGIVRMVSGEPLKTFVIENIKTDAIFFSAMFAALLLLTKIFTESLYHIGITIIAFFLFLSINSLLNLKMLKIDFRKDVISKHDAKNVLTISYIYKCAIIIVAIFAMAGNISLISDGVDYYRQKAFFQDHAQYSYANITTFSQRTFEQDLQSVVGMMSSRKTLSLIDLQVQSSDRDYIYAAGDALTYLTENIPELKDLTFASKVYFIIPEKYENAPDVIEETQNVWALYFRDKYDYETITYRKAEIIGVYNAGTSITSSIKTSPIIIYNNMDASSYSSFFNLGYISGSTMFSIPEQGGVSESGVNYLTNVNDNYLFHLKSAERNITTGIVFLVLILLLNAVISKSLFYYEYKINAIENCLKKVLGYGFLRINFRVFALSVISSVAAIIISCIILLLLKGNSMVTYNVAGGVSIILLDFVIESYYIHRMSRISMNRILKGGNL